MGKYEIIIEEKSLRRLQKLLKKLSQANVFIVTMQVRIEVESPDTRIYGFQPWYPIRVVKKEKG